MRSTSLDTVCDIEMGQAPRGTSYNDIGEGYPLLAGAGDFGVDSPVPSKFTTEPTKISRPGDILLCIRATIGDLNWSDREYCLGRGVAGLRPKNGELDGGYLWRWLSFARSDLEKRARGSTFKQVSRQDISDLKILLPSSVDEQRRIATILDWADGVRIKRMKIIAYTEKLLRSAFLDTFGDPVTNPYGWPIRSLGEVCTKITDGVHAKPKYTNQGVPFVSVKDITTGKLDLSHTKFISEEDHRNYCKRCFPLRGDVLYTKVGATYGRPALVDTDQEFSLYVSVSLIQPDRKIIEPRFLNEIMATPSVKRQADRSIKGIGVPDLHLNMIREFKIPVPERDKQLEYIYRTQKIHTLDAALRKALSYEEALMGALSQRAFRGEL